MATQRTATDVAEMESDLVLARAEVERLRTQVAVLTQENGNLRSNLAQAEGIAREEMIRATQMETIMSQVSMGLVAGLNKMQDRKRSEREARRLDQERALGVGDSGGPSFVRTPPMADGGFVQPRGREGGTLIAEAGGTAPRRAALPERQPIDRLSGASMERRVGEPIDHPLLPRVEARTAADEDADELRNLGERMTGGERNA